MKQIMRGIMLLLVAALLAGVALFVMARSDYDTPGPLAQKKTVLFVHGEKFANIAADLDAQEVIRNRWFFEIMAALHGDARKFKAGEYKFPAGATPRAVADMIAQGRVVIHKITIPEGLTVKEILRLLDNEPALTGTVSGTIAEGSLLPETYHFTHGETRQGIVTQMQEKMVMLLAHVWQNRKQGLPLDSPQQAVTLASIVEKETGVSPERGRVASVFINRLRKGIKLQSDPTVVYGIEQDGPLGRALTTADLQAPTAYNTYTITGLPPAPICNPGKAALIATLNPPDTDDLYFVATGTGGHNFAATLEQHNKNVAAYREKLQGK